MFTVFCIKCIDSYVRKGLNLFIVLGRNMRAVANWTGRGSRPVSFHDSTARFTTLYEVLYVCSLSPTRACTGGSCGGCLTGFGGALTSTHMA